MAINQRCLRRAKWLYISPAYSGSGKKQLRENGAAGLENAWPSASLSIKFATPSRGHCSGRCNRCFPHVRHKAKLSPMEIIRRINSE
jgi:hypothetical protein